MKPHQGNCEGVFNYVHAREAKSNVTLKGCCQKQCIATNLPRAITEKEISVGDVDKIFAAQWLDDLHVVCGTKCNKIIVQNIITRRIWQIPVLEGSGNIRMPEKNCGIHSISKNPSSTLLATGAENPSSIGIYQLPSLQPICIGESHTDWMFTSAWISDNVLATGSRDKSLAIWSIPNSEMNDKEIPASKYPVISPIYQIQGKKALDKIRAIVYNPDDCHVASVASNGFLHLWDVNRCMEVVTAPMPFMKENVCVAHQSKVRLYAVGSLSHVSLLDSRDAKPASSLCSKDEGAGVRSISFNESVITIGTGYGSLFFYDVRMMKLLMRQDDTVCSLKTGKGWLRRDAVYHQYFWENECYPNAVYAHCYDPSGMRLFTAGGPLALGLYGNYAAYWD